MVASPESDIQAGFLQSVALLKGRMFCVLSGAGISTESGIPDYRGPESSQRVRTPIQHHAFVTQASTRQRYWARATLGWARFSNAQANAGHRALATLERQGNVRGLITQNVDRLHQQAGHRDVIELHGALADVRCLVCAHHESRESVQYRHLLLNPGWLDLCAAMAPDGDTDLDSSVISQFIVADCLRCGGALKPDVVFFGGNVARAVVDAAMAWVEASDALLVVGTSLTVFSGLRFVRHAHAKGKAIVVINRGVTRGDPLADVRVNASAGDALTALASALA
ncbi:MAG: NAD-dependent protein deacetylase [Deltaproteobacteria bacterium]|nr:NAD-dependent protein deacetylase [Deltaproteobacteria bacterium]